MVIINLYRIQNSTADKEPFVTECSKRLPKFNFVESTDASSNISEVGRLLKMPSDPLLYVILNAHPSRITPSPVNKLTVATSTRHLKPIR
jgi:hypothetical protein